MTQALFDEEKTRLEKIRTLFWLVLVIVLIGVAALLVVSSIGRGALVSFNDSFYAVFLDNDQVYFGKLRSLNRDWWVLNDIYYLRAGGAVQSGSETSGQIDLIKLGAEIHAPKDEMIINRQRVLFYEEIGENSEVMKMILEHKSENLR